MKKIVLNISDITYQKLKLEAIYEKKSLADLIEDRIFYKPFSSKIEQSFDDWIKTELNEILKE